MEDSVAVEILDPEELDWVQVRAYIAPDLAQLARTARADGALIRCREVRSADDLIRTILAYACGGVSLADIGAWATEEGLADLWPTDHILQLFRARWQIEMHIKRMKGILDLDRIRAQREDVVQTCVLAKLLLALIVEDIIRKVCNCRPEWFHSPCCVPSLWVLTQMC